MSREVAIPRTYRVSLNIGVLVPGESQPRKLGVNFEAYGPNMIEALEDVDWEALGLKERLNQIPELGEDVDPSVLVEAAGSIEEIPS